MLMSTQFSLAYTCACACACAYVYAYALVKTRLKISNFRVNTTSRWVLKQFRISFGSISPLLYVKLAVEHIHSSQANTVSLLWCAAKWSFVLYDCSSVRGPFRDWPIRAQQIFSRPIRIAHFTHVTYWRHKCPYLGMVLHVTPWNKEHAHTRVESAFFT